MKMYLQQLFILTLASLVFACGGGGGSSPSKLLGEWTATLNLQSGICAPETVEVAFDIQKDDSSKTATVIKGLNEYTANATLGSSTASFSISYESEGANYIEHYALTLDGDKLKGDMNYTADGDVFCSGSYLLSGEKASEEEED